MYVTPAERVEFLREMLPSAGDTLTTLLNEHQSALYSQKAGDASRARRAALSLLVRTLLARLRQFWAGIRYRLEIFG